MKALPIPAAQDIARIVRPTVEETEQRLHAYYTDPSRGIFTYGRALGLCRFAFGHSIPLQQILDACKVEHTPVGRRQNAEVLKLVWGNAASRSVVTRALLPKRLSLRKDLEVRVAPPFYFVERDKAYVYWLQPRKGHALSLAELGLLASMVKVAFLVNDFENVGFEVCDLSAPLGKERDVRTYHLESLNILSEQEVHDLLQRFARAYDLLTKKGVQRYQRPQKRPQTGPDLFDEPK